MFSSQIKYRRLRCGDMSSVVRIIMRVKRADSWVSQIAKIILSALILTACLGENDFAFVAPNSEGGDVPKDSSPYSPGKWKATRQYFVTVERLRVHYIESGTGRTVVMIHGNAGGVEDFEFGAVQLLSREYRVLAIDRPGHGRSERPAGKTATVEYQVSANVTLRASPKALTQEPLQHFA